MYQVLSGILNHPLNKGRPVKALSRFLSWQLRSRTVGSDIVPFVDNTRLLIRRGMHSATAQHYCGLADFEEMGFVLHALRAGDLFFDVGANVGVYTVLASVTGAKVKAFEPCPSTYRRLLSNINLNNIRPQVDTYACALGAKDGEADFTFHLDSCNHVVVQDELGGERVWVQRLDSFFPTWPIRQPRVVVIKIDVEGFEKDVMEGGTNTFQVADAVIIELLNGSGTRYGYDDWELHGRMLDMGFRLHRYDPFTRVLRETDEIIGGNNLYVRDAEFVRERLKTAPHHWVHERMI
jgi:FkbM family methyltransferase